MYGVRIINAFERDEKKIGIMCIHSRRRCSLFVVAFEFRAAEGVNKKKYKKVGARIYYNATHE